MTKSILGALLLIAGCSGGGGGGIEVSLDPSLAAAGDAGAAGEPCVAYDGPIIHEPRDGLLEPPAPRLPSSCP